MVLVRPRCMESAALTGLPQVCHKDVPCTLHPPQRARLLTCVNHPPPLPPQSPVPERGAPASPPSSSSSDVLLVDTRKKTDAQSKVRGAWH